ncbi:YceI family protein [Balneola sp. MJW-20]|uniref:YceI family protein n=1 Tax=Gracilimonas aurantiaca TaxID=3234185 RepID=UPI003466C9BC
MTIFRYLAIVLFLILPAQADAQLYRTDNGKAVFYSKVPLYTFSGESKYLVGQIDPDKKIVDFYLDLTTLDSGLEKRDRDMREVLETDEYPFAEFYGELISDFNPGLKDTQNVLVKGDFTIHGVTKEMEIKGKLTPSDEGIHLIAKWIVRLEDHDIIPPKLLFVKVDQEQEIEIETLLKPKEN